MSRCKITVVNTPYFKDLDIENLGGPCDVFKAGEVFYTGGPCGVNMPEGFCPEAWYAIQREVYVAACGGLVCNEHGRFVACCNDGIRPTSFVLERVD